MDAAKAAGAIGIFEEKYGDVVRMLRIEDSIELCGGTHARRTGTSASSRC
jgi:alanyl-tRNA synthetase